MNEVAQQATTRPLPERAAGCVEAARSALLDALRQTHPTRDADTAFELAAIYERLGRILRGEP